jgi:hypothetical protein
VSLVHYDSVGATQLSRDVLYERELLDCRDDDRLAAIQGGGELGGVGVNLLDHALLVLELIDVVL